MKVHVALANGRDETLSLPESSTARDLKIMAQKALEQKFLKLITAGGYVFADPLESLQAAGIKDGDRLTAISIEVNLVAAVSAFALCVGGQVTTWGNPRLGGDSSKVKERLSSVTQVQSTRQLGSSTSTWWPWALLDEEGIPLPLHTFHVMDILFVDGFSIDLNFGSSVVVLPDFVLGPPYPSRPIDYVGQHTLRFAFLASVKDQLREAKLLKGTSSAFAAILEGFSNTRTFEPSDLFQQILGWPMGINHEYDAAVLAHLADVRRRLLDRRYRAI
ncbi:Ubiquitin-like domain-containing protein [Durusdinium trenchii]|uniref:Ubiquitin-like domain-containing protein n=1 Tax=Durusdinium trenchii TaxID=1381693 RepID=A0ABP0I0X9_9DINO